MKSVDALRKWADGLSGVWIDPNDHSIIVTTCDDMPPSMDCVSLRDHINGILDGIEREVADMVPLPVDADGVPIHVGDMLDGYGKTIEVVEIRYGRSGWVLISRDGNGYADTFAFTHHHAPTVEDVLREFIDSWSDTEGREDERRVMDEYAAKLQLKEE